MTTTEFETFLRMSPYISRWRKTINRKSRVSLFSFKVTPHMSTRRDWKFLWKNYHNDTRLFTLFLQKWITSSSWKENNSIKFLFRRTCENNVFFLFRLCILRQCRGMNQLFAQFPRQPSALSLIIIVTLMLTYVERPWHIVLFRRRHAIQTFIFNLIVLLVSFSVSLSRLHSIFSLN